MSSSKGDYLRLSKDIELRRERLKEIGSIDTIIFDIDGVLINVEDSFRKVSCLTVKAYFSLVLGWSGEKDLLSIEETELFKLAGGFNDDWDLSAAAVLFYLVKAEELGISNINRLAKYRLSLPEFTKEAAVQGGGLKGAQKVLFSSLSPKKRTKVLRLWDRGAIKQIFQETYAGRDKVKEVYGVIPKYIKQRQGLWKEERVILKRAPLPSHYHYAIITGRTKGEVRLALRFLKWENFIPLDSLICSDDQMKKPNPLSLVRLGRRLRTKVGIYIGDTLDDLRLTQEYKKIRKRTLFLSGIVLSGPQGAKNKEVFMEEGADIIARDVNKLVKYLAEEGIHGKKESRKGRKKD